MRTQFRIRASALLCLATAACSDITSLEQDAPSRVLGNTLRDPSAAPLLVNSVITDFECALGTYIVAGAMVGDEFLDAQLSQAVWDLDRRTVFPELSGYATGGCGGVQSPGVYTPLSTTRFLADNTLELLQGWTDQQVPNRGSHIATVAAYGGYSLVLLGEGMCSAALDGGPELSREEVFAEAVDRFTSAIEAATAANNTDILNLARVGRARALLNLGQYAAASDDAELVPASFVRNATYAETPNRRQNNVHSYQFIGLFGTVDPTYRGLTFGGSPDPRVTVVSAGVNGHDTVTPIWRSTKYPLVGSPIPIGSGDEALLIVAEAEARVGNPNNAVTIINQLHTKVGLPPFAGGTQPQILAQVLEERRRELFLEGQRLGDMIRTNAPLVPAPGTPFGKGGTYGTQLCFPLPAVERDNNPNI
jgi:hypothetical protein